METCAKCDAVAEYVVAWFGKDDEPLCKKHTPRWFRRKARLDARQKARIL